MKRIMMCALAVSALVALPWRGGRSICRLPGARRDSVERRGNRAPIAT